jgi:hypothetical protein
MNDITKARTFLTAMGSKLQYLQSFGLMLATAEQRYRDLQLRKQGNRDVAGTLEEIEVNVTLEMAVLRYLKRTNRLPGNITDAFRQGVTTDEKLELAKSWMNG